MQNLGAHFALAAIALLFQSSIKRSPDDYFASFLDVGENCLHFVPEGLTFGGLDAAEFDL